MFESWFKKSPEQERAEAFAHEYEGLLGFIKKRNTIRGNMAGHTVDAQDLSQREQAIENYMDGMRKRLNVTDILNEQALQGFSPDDQEMMRKEIMEKQGGEMAVDEGVSEVTEGVTAEIPEDDSKTMAA